MDNPWTRLPAQPPFVLPEDASPIATYNSSAAPETMIHLEVPPLPYLGRPDAPILLLATNPGFDPDDVKRNEAYDNYDLKNLAHAPLDYPFYWLDPVLYDSPGYKYWATRVAALTKLYDAKRVANALLCVEYFPYPSVRAAQTPRLASQEYGFHLVRGALKRNAAVIILRAKDLWIGAVHELATYPYFEAKNRRAAFLSEANLGEGFTAICGCLDKG